jgi:hypothetical protein
VRRLLAPAFLGACVVATVVTLVAIGDDPLGPGHASTDPTRGLTTTSRFELVHEGMRPGEVRALLGLPATRVRSIAEGLAWPEPDEICWEYGSSSQPIAFQVCFVDGRLVSASAYPVEGGEP